MSVANGYHALPGCSERQIPVSGGLAAKPGRHQVFQKFPPNRLLSNSSLPQNAAHNLVEIVEVTALLKRRLGMGRNSQADNDNHANQLNSNNDAFWESRGYDERPDDWDDLEDSEY